MKKIICLVVVLCFIFIPYSLTAYAATDLITEILIEAVEAAWSWESSTNSEVKSMSGAEFYNWYSGNGGFDSAAWRAVVAAASVEAALQSATGYSNPIGIIGTWGISKGVTSAVTGMGNGAYNAAYVSRDLVESLNNAAVDYGQEFRGTVLDDLGISLSSYVRSDVVTVFGSNVLNLGLHGQVNSGITIPVYPGVDCVGFFHGSSACPPFFIVPGSVDAFIYQDGVELPNAAIFFVLGGDTLARIPWYWDDTILCFNANGSNVNDYSLDYGRYHYNTTYSRYDIDYGYSEMSFYRGGLKIADLGDTGYDDYTVADLFNKSRGIYIDLDDSEYEPPVTYIPDDIPYDDDDHVIMIVPSDHTGDDDVIFMSPTDYNNYVTEGDIIEGDTVNNFDNSTIENITNNYTNIINDLDTEPITTRLDTIIQKLDKIYNAVKNIDISPTYITNQWSSYLNPEPCYESFSDCITTNIPLAADIQTLVNSMNVQTASSGFDTNNNVVLNSSGGSGSNNLDTVQSAFTGLNVSLSWYEPYRQDIRTFFQMCCYGFGIIALWHAVKSVFGVHGGGGDV